MVVYWRSLDAHFCLAGIQLVGHISTGLVNCCSLPLPPNISARDCDFGLADFRESSGRFSDDRLIVIA
jgi:hypothetical protein